VQANYTLNVTNRGGKNAGKKSGQIYLKGQKYKITDKSMEITSDGRKMWKYEPAANEVTISNVDNSAGGITPQKLFTNFYDKDFLYKLNGDVAVGTKKFKEIELTPTDKSKPFFKVLLYIDMATQTISSTKLFEKTGNRYIYAVTGFNGSSAIADSKFVLDAKKYPGVEVVDLR
jgi:outer membrane lipoprotein-sorting protein